MTSTYLNRPTTTLAAAHDMLASRLAGTAPARARRLDRMIRAIMTEIITRHPTILPSERRGLIEPPRLR